MQVTNVYYAIARIPRRTRFALGARPDAPSPPRPMPLRWKRPASSSSARQGAAEERPERARRSRQGRQAGGRQAVQRSQRRRSKRRLTRRRSGSTRPARQQEGDPQFDPTLPGQPLRLGQLHPITQTIEELKDIMGRLGFTAGRWPGDRRRVAQLRGPQYSAASIRPAIRSTIFIWPRPVGVRSRAHRTDRRSAAAPQPDQHGANSRDGEDAAAGADHFARPRLSARRRPTPRTIRCSIRSKGC